MLATGMKTAVEGILSSREARKSALQGMKEDLQTGLRGYREALAAEGAHQRGAWLALRSALKAGRARLRVQMQQGFLVPMRADLAQARMEWQRTAQAEPTAGHSVKREYVSPPGKAHQQRGKRQA